MGRQGSTSFYLVESQIVSTKCDENISHYDIVDKLYYGIYNCYIVLTLIMLEWQYIIFIQSDYITLCKIIANVCKQFKSDTDVT